MFLRLKFPLASFLIGFSVVLAGCNEGTNTEPTIKGATDFVLPDEPPPAFVSSSLKGELQWDFIPYGTASNLQMYRTHFQTGTLGPSNLGGTIHTNLRVGSSSFSPAVVSVDDSRVYLHSRVDGSTMLVTDLRKKEKTCNVVAYSDEDLEAGLVFVSMSGPDQSCSESVADNNHYWVSFDDDGVSYKRLKLSMSGMIVDPIFDNSGTIDSVLVLDISDRRAALYDRNGQLLREVFSEQAWPVVTPVGPATVTRSDRYLAIKNNGRFFITTIAQFIDSGLAGLNPRITGLSPDFWAPYHRSASPVILDRGRIFLVDEINRTTRLAVDFSNRVESGWDMESVYQIGENLVVFLRLINNDGFDQELWFYDRSEDSLELLFEPEGSQMSSGRSDTHAYFTFEYREPLPDPLPDPAPEQLVEFRTYVIDPEGVARKLEGSSYISGISVNSRTAPGSRLIGLRSEEYDSIKGLIDAEIWLLDPDTLEFSQRLGRLPADCHYLFGEYVIESRYLISSSWCDDQNLVYLLDTDLGTLGAVRPAD